MFTKQLADIHNKQAVVDYASLSACGTLSGKGLSSESDCFGIDALHG